MLEYKCVEAPNIAGCLEPIMTVCLQLQFETIIMIYLHGINMLIKFEFEFKIKFVITSPRI